MTNDFKLPGGKGINVSRILKRMETESTALGFLGGFTGSFIADWLKKKKSKRISLPCLLIHESTLN